MSDLVGQQWGSYHLTRLLGRGGFAEVYLGEHARLKMKAAIKILHTYLSEKDAGQFRQEAQIISRLMHPHIVRLLDFDLNNGRPFLVLDYAPQGSLRQRPGERLPLPQVVTYVRQAASALQYAHDQRLIHRDVKPANMLLGRQQEVLLSDFGIAAVIHSTSSMSQQNAVGTLVYMAPEQIQGYPRLASDQYALAVTVYQWLCGVLPFQGALSDIITGHLTRTPQRLRDLDDAIPVAVEEIVLTALAKDPLQRFASVSAFATALEQAALSSTPTFLQAPSTQIEQQQVVQQRASGPMIEVDTSQQAQEQQRRSRRSLLINGTVAVGMIALGGGILLSRRFSLPTGSSAPSGPVIYTYTGHVSQNKNAPNGIFSLSWSPDSKSIASIGYSSQSRNDFTVQVWGARGDGHPALYQVKEPVARGTDSYVLDLCWTQDGPQVVSATESGLITVANAANGNETLTYREHINNGEQVQSVA